VACLPGIRSDVVRVVRVVREQEQQARESARAELTEGQRMRADALEVEARRTADAPLRRSSHGGWTGIGGGRPR
jgi:hypothetical protein